jgi:hypothetical protein
MYTRKRYGSLEPISRKSYIELEYEYAHEKGKPSFAVVIKEDHLKERVRARGTDVIEGESQQQLKVFRQTVLSGMSKFWSDDLSAGRQPPRSVVLTDWPSMITTDAQVARPASRRACS